MKKNILVTGSSGTIGTRLCELYQVLYAVDIKANLWHNNIGSNTIISDLRNPECIHNLPKNVDIVIHLASNARVYDLVLDPQRAMDNLLIMFNILEYCRINHIKKLIFASSREVYGNSEAGHYAEEDVILENCESPYTFSKMSGEAMIYAYHRCYGIDYIILRFSNVYGMYDLSDRVIPQFMRKSFHNDDLIIYGETKTLDFTYIDDTIDGIVRSIERFDIIKNNVINIASGKSISLVFVAKQIINHLNGLNSIIIAENRTGEVLCSAINISKAKKILNYEPNFQISEGLEKATEWYKRVLINQIKCDHSCSE